ncbi:MAG: hypothetical protein V3T58_00510 [Candidatus Hydrothermarchaeales archaeon]
MRFISFIKFYVMMVAFLFILYSLYDLGLKREIFLFLALSLLSPTLFKGAIKARGIKRGDMVLISMTREDAFGSYVQKIPARALTNGRLGDVIELEYGDKKASGEITSYGGFIFPPDVNLLYYEKIVNI